MASTFYRSLHVSKDENGVDKAYCTALLKELKIDGIEYPYKCDGYIEQYVMYDEKTRVLRLLMEFKYEKNFNNAKNRAMVLVQVLYYLKRFQQGVDKEYSDIPNIILAGDKSSCFIVSVNDIKKYLDYRLDWSIAPSMAAKANPDLIKEIENTAIKISLFDIMPNTKMSEIVKRIRRTLLACNYKEKITEHNISLIYEMFVDKVIKEPYKFAAQDLVFFFINVITDNIDTFIHSKRQDTLVVRQTNDIKINKFSYEMLISEWCTKYTPSEEDILISIQDRLIEDTTRRRKGEFFTPTTWCKEAHKEIEKVIGVDWREKCIVWDCAWGTGNLTRDYYFSNLFCSTLREEDLLIGDRYNINSKKFVYDFLNDDINEDISIPKCVEEAIKMDKPIVFFINPPFAEASNGKVAGKSSKECISKTKIKEFMDNEKLGSASQQLYVQFLYRIMKIKKRYNIKEMYVCNFATSLYLTGERCSKFRNLFLNEFDFKSGFIFNASDFSNVSQQWEVLFSVWASGKTQNMNSFNVSVKEKNPSGKIQILDKKVIYNVPKNLRGTSWIKREVKNKKEDIICLTSSVKTNGIIKQKNIDTLAFLINDSNNVYGNTQGVYILSCPVSRHVKITQINMENFEECCSLFAARKVIKSTWLNQKEEYMIPNKNHPKYKDWVCNSIIISIFNNSALSSSLREIEVDNNRWNIVNNFFFMGNDEIRNLADINRNRCCFDDAKLYFKERFMYKYINSIKLTAIGDKILQNARKLVVLSFTKREEFNKLFPEYNINAWDAGWYQIKALLKYYYPNELSSFNDKLKELENEMKPLVYELGFLKS